MLKFEVLAEIAPVGSHEAEFLGCKEMDGQFDKPALCFLYAVRGGPHDGKVISRITSTELRLGNSLGQLLSRMCDRELPVGTHVAIEDLVGKRFRIRVEAVDEHRVRIADIEPIYEASVPAG